MVRKLGKILGLIVLLALPAVWLTLEILRVEQVKCSVCMAYQGNEKCRDAEGPDREQCLRTATDNACAFLTSGMTNSLACGRTTPLSVSFGDEPAPQAGR